MIYRDSDQLHLVLENLFKGIALDPQAVQSVSESHLIVRLRFQAPAADVTINGRKSPPKIMFGSDSLHPDLDIEMNADTFHRIMLGELPLGKAFSGNMFKIRGPIWKSFVLQDIFHSGQKMYPQIWEEVSNS
jgi:hypothetical protein